jgi:hypothetical protein
LNKLMRLFVLALVMAFVAMPIAAQDGGFGLGADDLALWQAANANSAAQSQFSFGYDVSFALDSADAVGDAVLSGAGVLDAQNGLGSISIDGTGNGLQLEGELRVVGDYLYVRGTDPIGGTDTGWFSLNAAELAAANVNFDSLGGELSDAFLEGFAEGAGVDSSNFNEDALFETLIALSMINPQDFIAMTRTDSGNLATFTVDISLRDLMNAPGMSEVSRQFLIASAILPEASTGEVAAFNALVGEALADTIISVDQTVDTNTNTITQTSILLSSTIDPASIGETGAPISFVLTLDITISGYGQAGTVVEPAGATEIPASLLIDSLGLETGSAGSGMGAAPMPPAGGAVELTCFTAATEFEGDTGATFTGTCPADCNNTVWGTDNYTDDSSICTAAVHAGAIPASGGNVNFVIGGEFDSFTGSERNGVTTSDWGYWGRTFSFTKGAAAAPAATGGSGGASLANSYSFPTGMTFGFSNDYTISNESEVMTMVQAPTGRAFIQIFDMKSLFGDMDMGEQFFMDTYGQQIATTWGFAYDSSNYVPVATQDGRQLQVLDFTGVQNGEPVTGRLVIVPMQSGGHTYVMGYALAPVPPTFNEDIQDIAFSISG